MKFPMDSFFRGVKPGTKIIVDGKPYDVVEADDLSMTVEPRPSRPLQSSDREHRALARISRRIV